MEVKKPWWKSKTIWFNVLTIGGAVATGLVGLLPTVQPLMSPAVYSVILMVVSTVNIILRAVTKHGLTKSDT